MNIRALRSAFWIGVYFIIAMAPILAMHNPVVLFIATPETLIMLEPRSITWWMAGGVAAFFSFAAIIISSLYRKTLRLITL